MKMSLLWEDMKEISRICDYITSALGSITLLFGAGEILLKGSVSLNTVFCLCGFIFAALLFSRIKR